jgi:ribosomal protein L11 methyltransferase
MQWLELTIQTTSAGIDALGARLTALGYDSFIIDDEADFDAFLENNHQYWDYVDEDLSRQMAGKSQIRLFLEDGPAAMETVAWLRGELAAFRLTGGDELGSLALSVTSMQDEDWENNWKQYYQPLPIGKKLLVVPKWMADLDPAGRVPVYLDPGMIFGTGAHASTQMCMRALEDAVTPGCRVVDLGSGSGILSITALLLGAGTATGVDIDPKAEDIARENAALNGLGPDRFTAVTGDVIGDRTAMEQLSQGGYDLVLANIVADVIIPLAPVVPHFLRSDARFICSGILDSRVDEVIAALEAAGLTLLAKNQQEDWCQLTACLAAQKEEL